jgi:2-polyprenyl-3-methyl-5-hydroxy-6-metoxy-1,4-benzoquinol methylase
MTDHAQTGAFLERVMADVGAARAVMLTSLGSRLGLYTAMAGAGPVTSEDLAKRTDLSERLVREWLASQVAGEYVRYDPAAQTYLLPDAHAAVLADADSPAYAIGSFTVTGSLYEAEDRLVDAFRSGEGLGWDQYAPAMYEGTAVSFRTGYKENLVQSWLPGLDGVVKKLEGGASVADVGCGYGYSTLLMAQAYPASRFHGYDFHQASIEKARRLAAEQGLADRVTFEVATAQDFPGEKYDLITFFDSLHDQGDPGGALRHAEQVMAPDGTCMIVEPNASGNLLDNINPVGRMYTTSSVAVCLPAAMAQKGPHALGNHAGEEAMRAIADEAGLHTWNLVQQSVMNCVYDVKR